jgi:hypothetical protein
VTGIPSRLLQLGLASGLKIRSAALMKKRNCRFFISRLQSYTPLKSLSSGEGGGSKPKIILAFSIRYHGPLSGACSIDLRFPIIGRSA